MVDKISSIQFTKKNIEVLKKNCPKGTSYEEFIMKFIKTEVKINGK